MDSNGNLPAERTGNVPLGPCVHLLQKGGFMHKQDSGQLGHIFCTYVLVNQKKQINGAQRLKTLGVYGPLRKV